jgi:hypothetical protein
MVDVNSVFDGFVYCFSEGSGGDGTESCGGEGGERGCARWFVLGGLLPGWGGRGHGLGVI